MPIFEYQCRECRHEFELLVRGETTPCCPSCSSHDLERLLSLPRVHSASTKQMGLKAAKKRDAAQARDRMHAQQQYEKSHDRHG